VNTTETTSPKTRALANYLRAKIKRRPASQRQLEILERWTTHKCARRTNGITRFDWRLIGRRRSHCESIRKTDEQRILHFT